MGPRAAALRAGGEAPAPVIATRSTPLRAGAPSHKAAKRWHPQILPQILQSILKRGSSSTHDYPRDFPRGLKNPLVLARIADLLCTQQVVDSRGDEEATKRMRIRRGSKSRSAPPKAMRGRLRSPILSLQSLLTQASQMRHRFVLCRTFEITQTPQRCKTNAERQWTNRSC